LTSVVDFPLRAKSLGGGQFRRENCMTNKALRLAVFLLVLGTLSVGAVCQNIPSCSVSSGPTVCTPSTCSCSGNGFASTIPAANCYHLTISCTNVPNGGTINDLGITFGFQTPPSGTIKGTIVFLSPMGGTIASDPASTCPNPPCYNEVTYFEDYLNTYNYQVVQTAWDTNTDPAPGWEDTGTSTKYVGYAAGRVAAFLSWAYGSSLLYGGVYSINNQAGMCAQGNSAGGGGIAYFLAWYMGQTGYPGNLDHAEFLSSPPLSDIERGCKKVIPDPGDSVTVCGNTNQLGCSEVTPNAVDVPRQKC
jgi:hypothetical protein